MKAIYTCLMSDNSLIQVQASTENIILEIKAIAEREVKKLCVDVIHELPILPAPIKFSEHAINQENN